MKRWLLLMAKDLTRKDQLADSLNDPVSLRSWSLLVKLPQLTNMSPLGIHLVGPTRFLKLTLEIEA